MNTRLKQFIAAENITQAQLADTINVVRASVSHILAGRNKPSYEFISGLMKHYPHLNIEWLMFGKGKMYRQTSANEDVKHVPAIAANESGQLFEQIEEDVTTEPEEILKPYKAISLETPMEARESGIALSEIKTLLNDMQKPVHQRKLIKITAFYDDGTFQELS
jgi:transcriptional regulator with XRE-family HTH domain